MQCHDECEANEALRQLRKAIHRPRLFSPKLGLSAALSRALALLYKRELVSPEALIAVYSSKEQLSDPDNMAKVAIYKLRRALNPYGIGIHTRYGAGFYMTEKSKELLKPYIIRI